MLPLSSSRRALPGLATCMLIAAIGTSIANIALPSIALAFSASVSAAQWVVTAYLLAVTLGSVAAGRLGDRIGPRRGLHAGLTVFLLGTLCSAMAPQLWALILARAVQGLGAAALMVLTLAAVRAALPADRTGRAMGMLGTMSAAGTALGPALGGLLIEAAGWRATFWGVIPLCLAAFVLTRRLPAPLAQPAPQPASVRPIAPSVVPRLASTLLVASVMMTTLVVGPFYLGGGLGLTPQAAGLVLATGPAMSMISGVPAGRLVDRYGATKGAVVGLAALICGALVMTGLRPNWGAAGYIFGLALMTPGYQLFQAANTTQVVAQAPADQRATQAGWLNLSRNLGLTLGAILLGGLFAYSSGPSPDEVTRGLHLTFAACTGLLTLAQALILWVGRRQACANSNVSCSD